MSPERVSVGEEGEGHSMLMDRRQKKAQEPTEEIESGARNLEAESTRSRMGSTGEGGGVKVEDSHRQLSFLARTIKEWNQLPSEAKESRHT